MTVGILALQGDFAAHAAALARLGVATRLVRGPAQLESLDALVLPGGESTTMLKFLAKDGFGDKLRAFVAERPAFATCAGAILLARRVTQPEQASLGLLDVTVVRNAYGRQLESSIRTAQVQPAFTAALGREIEAVLIRAPQFRDLGPGVEVVATAGDEPVLLRQGRLLAASFHPELSADPAVHRWFIDQINSPD